MCVYNGEPVKLEYDVVTHTNLKPFHKPVNPTLHGCKPSIRSYLHKLCLLRLIICTNGTACAKRLHGGVLSLCLLDMLYLCCLNVGLLTHPIHDTMSFITINDKDRTTVPNLSKAVNALECAKVDDVCKFELLNKTGFSRYYEDDVHLKYPIPNDHVEPKSNVYIMSRQ